MAFNIFPKHRGNSDVNEDSALRILSFVMFIGTVAMIFVSWFAARNKPIVFVSILGLSVIIALAALLVGGIFGFLFGIPRSFQKNTEDGSSSPPSGPILENQRKYSDNTNLEQISDWLTKIIVGVSLTQLPSIERRFHVLSNSLAAAFSPHLSHHFAYAYAACIVSFYAISGFIAVYLWAKIYLLQQLENRFSKLLTRQSETFTTKLEIARIEGRINDFIRQRHRVNNAESDPEIKDLLEVARPEPVKYLDDCQKERWGRSDRIGDFKLEATFQENAVLEDKNYDVTLVVSGPVIEGSVYFFLHDSYYPEIIKEIEAVNNVASLTITSYEAFTAAAVCNGGQIKLELDLNTYPSAPDDYKYQDPLYTLDELKKKLQELKQKEE